MSWRRKEPGHQPPWYCPLWGEPPVTGGFLSQRPYFLWFAPEQTVEQTIKMPVVWDTITLIITSLHHCNVVWWPIASGVTLKLMGEFTHHLTTSRTIVCIVLQTYCTCMQTKHYSFCALYQMGHAIWILHTHTNQYPLYMKSLTLEQL